MKGNLLRLMTVVATAACAGNPLDLDDLDGTYAYRALANDGTLLIEGDFVITTQTPDGNGGVPFVGTWTLTETVVQTAVMTGPQVGTGTVSGRIIDDELNANLHPENADNNVFLSGSLGRSWFEGRWSYSTFVGEVGAGPFHLEKIR
jgi:hypothetical protein